MRKSSAFACLAFSGLCLILLSAAQAVASDGATVVSTQVRVMVKVPAKLSLTVVAGDGVLKLDGDSNLPVAGHMQDVVFCNGQPLYTDAHVDCETQKNVAIFTISNI